MKERVKTKGRPKGKSKQLTFNKTSHDKSKKKRGKITKTRKSRLPDFIDDREMSSGEESGESEIAFKGHPTDTDMIGCYDDTMTDYSDDSSLVSDPENLCIQGYGGEYYGLSFCVLLIQIQ